MMEDFTPLSVRAVALRAVLRRCLALATAGMASYWTSCAEQRRCFESP